MKKILILLLFVFGLLHQSLVAQVAINADGAPAASSAMLDVKSANKGILIPRVTTSQRTVDIVSPADALLVYDTDTKSFWYYKAGTGWTEVSTTTSSIILPYAATTNSPAALFALTNQGSGAPIQGISSAATGSTSGVIGSSASTSNGTGASAGVTGVLGQVSTTTPGGYSAGVRGVNNGTTGTGIGVIGYQAGSGWGVYGETPSGFGVYGLVTNTSASNAGVRGETLSSNGIGVEAKYSGTGVGVALEVDNGAIRVVGVNKAAFTHTATVANKLSANGTDIDNALSNGDPNCILIVTQKLNPAVNIYNNSPIGVYYNTTRSKWEIFNELNTAIPTSAQFNVLVIKQ